MCFTLGNEIREIECDLIRSIKLDSKVMTHADGSWSGLPSFVIVTEKHPNIIQFYDLTGKNLFNEVLEDYAIVSSMFLSHNLLYIVDSSEKS